MSSFAAFANCFIFSLASVLCASEQSYTDIAVVHWVGARTLSSGTNAEYQKAVFATTEGKLLLEQTLDKLSLAPWRPRDATIGATNTLPDRSKAEKLRPLLDDVYNEESILHIRQKAGSRPEFALAIRLETERADAWRTNLLALISDSEKGQSPDGWRVGHSDFGPVALQHKLGWTVVSTGPAAEAFGQSLLDRARKPAGLNTGSSNTWVLAELNLPDLLHLLDIPSSSLLPKVTATLSAEGEYIRTRADLKFAAPLPLKFEPWTVPTNFIREPLIAFTAVQGFERLLSSLPWVKATGIADIPNQLFVWGLNTHFSHTFAVAPSTNISEVVEQNGLEWEGKMNAWITNHILGIAEFSKTNRGITWVPLPLFTPTFQALSSPVGDVLLGRLSPAPPLRGDPMPEELIARLATSTNVVLYGWEITEARVNQWAELAQSFRMAGHRGKMPPAAAAVEFLRAAAPKLGNCVTEITQSTDDPSVLQLTRKSHLGLTGFELHALADWLESPRFPQKSFTMLAAPPTVFRWDSKARAFVPSTNLPPAFRLNKQ